LNLYLHRASGNRSLLVGVPVHNRRTRMHKNTVGLFVKVLPVEVEVENNETFSSLLRKVRTECVQALRNAAPSTDKTLCSQPYDVILNYLHHTSRHVPNFEGKPIQCDWIHTGQGNNTLALHVQDFDKSGSLTFDFDFNVDTFDQKHRNRMIREYFELLEDFLLEAHHERFLNNLPN
jgi:non-ribosomal peptide synthetase component F